MEQFSTFSNEKRIENGEAKATDTERSNLEALNAQKEIYALKAIDEVKKKWGSKFTRENEPQIFADVMFLLQDQHKIDGDVLITPKVNSADPNDMREVNAVEEFYDTYSEEFISKLIEKQF